MNLNEFKNPDEVPRKKRFRLTPMSLVFIILAVLVAAIVVKNVWSDGDKKEEGYLGSNDIIFYDPTDDGIFNSPAPTTPTPVSNLICSQSIDACTTQANFDLEVARMTSELAGRGLSIGSEDVTVRDAQMSHLITDVCYKPVESTFVAAESMWSEIWVNTPQTNRNMRFVSALSAVCGDQIDTIRGYLTPKNPYEDPSYNDNVPNQPPSEYTPPMPPTANEGSTPHTETPPESAPSTGDRDYN